MGSLAVRCLAWIPSTGDTHLYFPAPSKNRNAFIRLSSGHGSCRILSSRNRPNNSFQKQVDSLKSKAVLGSTDSANLSDASSSLLATDGAVPQVFTSIWNWEGYNIRYQFSGKNGPAVVLIHGFGANCDHWRKNLPVLAKSHRVYAIDLLGYGYSDKPNPRDFPVNSVYTFENWAKQVNDFCTDIVKDQAFFVCNSIGGIVGLQAALMERNICRGIVLLNISLRMLHIKNQSWYKRPFVKLFQNLLRYVLLNLFTVNMTISGCILLVTIPLIGKILEAIIAETLIWGRFSLSLLQHQKL